MHPGLPKDAAVTANWNTALARLVASLQPDRGGGAANPTLYGDGFTPGDHEPIPRVDLPFGMPAFIGVSAHAERDGDDVLRVSARFL